MESAVRLHRVARWKREALVYLGAERKLVGDHAGLESSLAQAIDTLTIAFQPIVRASSGEIYGHEALVRNSIIALQHPTALFEAAERLGATQKLGRTIRARAAHSARTNGSESLFVNLHPTDLNDDELFSDTAPLSQRASSVVLEVTERTSLHTVSNLKGRIKTLRAMGFRIAVDDLGAGYAGLTSFAALEPDVVKLDMSIVRGVDADPIRRKLVSSMAAMCRELGILVVAEGVETLPEYQAVVELGCDLVQGFWTGRPIS
jgi:EAL domain-containing protein (putative c-di-GMP-specific phosphodiesterase class I)